MTPNENKFGMTCVKVKVATGIDVAAGQNEEI